MKISRLTMLGISMVCVCLLCAVAARGDAPVASDDQIKQEIEGFLKALDAPNAEDRNAAELNIENLTAADIPVIGDLAQHLELSAAAKATLATAMARLEPRTRLKAMQHKRDLQVTDWIRSSVLMDAKMHGRKTAWLDAVQKVIDLDARRSNATRMKELLAVRAEERKQIDAAIAAGCSDPSFMALDGLISADEGVDPEKVYSIFKKARDGATGLQISPYMMFVMDKRILWGMADNKFDGGVTQATWPEVRKRYCEMFDVLGALINNLDTPMQVRFEAIELQMETAHKLNIEIHFIHDSYLAALEKIAPNDAQMLYIKGKMFCLLAWESRGGGWANTVTPQQWKDFADRLQTSREALTKSYHLDPEDPAAATEMINVIIGQDGDRNTMEAWFKRAMDADPDNLQACYNKLNYLEPKWHGDAAAMLEFGRQSLKDGNWHTSDMPLLIAYTYDQLAAYEPDPAAFYHQPAVWNDLRPAYITAMEMYPKSIRIRTLYCYKACLCGQWKEADAQFKILGNNADAAVFGGDANMQAARKAAAALAFR